MTDERTTFAFNNQGSKCLAALKYAAAPKDRAVGLTVAQYKWDANTFTASTSDSYVMAERTYTIENSMPNREIEVARVTGEAKGSVAVDAVAMYKALTKAPQHKWEFINIAIEADIVTVSVEQYTASVPVYHGSSPNLEGLWPDLAPDGRYNNKLPAFSPHLMHKITRATGFVGAASVLPFKMVATTNGAPTKPIYIEYGSAYRALLMPIRV